MEFNGTLPDRVEEVVAKYEKLREDLEKRRRELKREEEIAQNERSQKVEDLRMEMTNLTATDAKKEVAQSIEGAIMLIQAPIAHSISSEQSTIDKWVLGLASNPRAQAAVRQGIASRQNSKKIDAEIKEIDHRLERLATISNCGRYVGFTQCLATRALQVVLAEKLAETYPELLCVRLDHKDPSVKVSPPTTPWPYSEAVEHSFSKFPDHYDQLDSTKKGDACNLIVWTGLLQEFARALNSKDQAQRDHMFVYASTPKELVERVSEISSARDALNLAFLIQAASGSVLGKSYLEVAQEREGLFESLRRQPIIVGFSGGDPNSMFRQGGNCKKDIKPKNPCNVGATEPRNRFGWVIGPRFKIKDDGKQAHFRHNVVQHGVAAQISVPVWWDKIQFRVRTGWVTEKGEVKYLDEYVTKPVELPIDVAALNGAVLPLEDPRGRRPERSSTSLDEGVDRFDVGSPASILVWGTNLFRVSRVSLGSQVTEEVEVLPGMEGIVARFPAVADPGGLDEGKEKPVAVRVWSAAGQVHVGQATIRKVSKEKGKGDVGSGSLAVAFGPQLVAEYGKEYALRVVEGKLPPVLPSVPVVRVRDKVYGWLPLQGGRIVLEDDGKKASIRFTLKVVGQVNEEAETARRKDIERQPLEIGLFLKSSDSEPVAISAIRPVLLKEEKGGTEKVTPTCEMIIRNSSLPKALELEVSFEGTPLKVLDQSFPAEKFKIQGDNLTEPQICARSEPFKCKSNVVVKDANVDPMTVKILNASAEDVGFEPVRCILKK